MGIFRRLTLLMGLFFASRSIHAQPTSSQAIPVETASQPVASENAPAPANSKFAPLALDAPYMTGDWGGARTYLENRGITTQFFFNSTYQWNIGGGLAPGGKHGATVDLFTVVDFEQLGLFENGRFLGHFRRDFGRGVNPWIGSNFQVADDLDDERNLYVAQLWYEHELIDREFWLRLGFLDYQTIADRNRFANSEDKQFLSQALDNNPLLPLAVGLGVELQYQPCNWFSIISGVGDAGEAADNKPFKSALNDSAEYLWYVEPAIHLKFDNPLGPGTLEGNYRVGMVYDGRERRKFPEPPATVGDWQGDDVGFYVSIDQDLFRENDTDLQGLGWFVRYGFRHGDVNLIENFWSTGFSYLGLIPTRDEDTLGVAMYQNVPSGRFQSYVNPFAHEETAFEAYYAIHITDWCVITPDIQYVSSPGTGDTVSDAIIVGVRTRISF